MRFFGIFLLALFWLTVKSLAARAESLSTTAPENRDLHGQVSADLHTLSNLIIPAKGLTFGSYINRQNLVVVQYNKGSIGISQAMAFSKSPTSLNLISSDDSEVGSEINGVIEDIRRTNITHSELSVQHRFFVNRSNFYLSSGFGYKQYGIEYPLEDISKYKDLSAVIATTKSIVKVGMGTRWVPYKSFLLNLEWLNIGVPLDRIASNQSQDIEQSDFARKYDKFTNQVIIQALNLSCGVVF